MLAVQFLGQQEAIVRERPAARPGPGEVLLLAKIITHRAPLAEAPAMIRLADSATARSSSGSTER